MTFPHRHIYWLSANPAEVLFVSNQKQQSTTEMQMFKNFLLFMWILKHGKTGKKR